jgi:hypothetical protein
MPPCTSAQHKWRAHARLPRIQANRSGSPNPTHDVRKDACGALATRSARMRLSRLQGLRRRATVQWWKDVVGPRAGFSSIWIVAGRHHDDVR